MWQTRGVATPLATIAVASKQHVTEPATQAFDVRVRGAGYHAVRFDEPLLAGLNTSVAITW